MKRFHRILLQTDAIFKEFRGRFMGKASPVHFFWGSFDLAVTRFSGRRAPEREGADPITREAYSHECSSAGFWPGGGEIAGAAFYSYAAPEPPGYGSYSVPPPAFYHQGMREYILMMTISARRTRRARPCWTFCRPLTTRRPAWATGTAQTWNGKAGNSCRAHRAAKPHDRVTLVHRRTFFRSLAAASPSPPSIRRPGLPRYPKTKSPRAGLRAAQSESAFQSKRPGGGRRNRCRHHRHRRRRFQGDARTMRRPPDRRRPAVHRAPLAGYVALLLLSAGPREEARPRRARSGALGYPRQGAGAAGTRFWAAWCATIANATTRRASSRASRPA